MSLTLVGVLARDGVVDLEETVLTDTERRTKGVGDPVILTSNAVFARWKVSAGEQAESRQEYVSVVAETQSDLASVRCLGKCGDAIAVDVAMICHGVQSRAHSSYVCRTRRFVLMIFIVAWDFFQTELLRTRPSMLAMQVMSNRVLNRLTWEAQDSPKHL